MAKKKNKKIYGFKKYQPGGSNPYLGIMPDIGDPNMEEYERIMQDLKRNNLKNSPINDLPVFDSPYFEPQIPNLSPITPEQKTQVGAELDGWNLDSDGLYRKNEITEDNRRLGFNSTFKALNPILDLTRLVANRWGDLRNSNKERRDLLNARFEDARYNRDSRGFNDVPVYYQTGGRRPWSDYINTTGYLDNTPTSTNPFNIIPGNHITMNGVSRRLIARPENENPVELPPNSGDYTFPNSSYVIETPAPKQRRDYNVWSDADAQPISPKNRKEGRIPYNEQAQVIIDKMISEGRSDLPLNFEEINKPQYKNEWHRKRGIIDGWGIGEFTPVDDGTGKYKIVRTNSTMINPLDFSYRGTVNGHNTSKVNRSKGYAVDPYNEYYGNEAFQQGGQNDQITQIIVAFAELNKTTPDAIMQELQKLKPEEQEQALQVMTQAVQEAQGQQVKTMQSGGTVVKDPDYWSIVENSKKIESDLSYMLDVEKKRGDKKAIKDLEERIKKAQNDRAVFEETFKNEAAITLPIIPGTEFLPSSGYLREHKYGGRKYKTGGVNIPEVRGQGQGNVELEKGEVFKDFSGRIKKVSESEDTHENGGSLQPDAQYILEDTADKRNDIKSKLLKISPDDAEMLTGFKPKKSVTHSKLFELATDFWGKKLKKIQKKVDANLDYVQNNADPIAQNSLEENLKQLEQFPTEHDLFNVIFEHQENIKNNANTGRQFKYGGSKRKYAVGGSGDIPPWAWDDAKSKDEALDNYYKEVQKLGYKGDKNIGDIQRYMVQNYSALVDDYMTNRNVPNTNKGKDLKNKGTYTPQGAFQDDLWWYRSMLPENKIFNTQEEIDAFIQGKDKIENNGVTYYTDPNDLHYQRRYVNPVLGINRIDPVAGEVNIKADPVAMLPREPLTFTEDATGSGSEVNIEGNVASPTEASKFNEPLRWYDVAGAINKYIGSERIPVDLEQMSRQPLQVRELNPLPALLQNQGDYNAALEQLPNSGVGYANQANMAANKYKVNNDIIGNYENNNKQRRDQIDQYNDQNQFALDQVNMQLRDQFVNRVLQGREVQRQQRLASLDGLFTKIALNNKLNREGDLMLKLSPHFDQYSNYNGNPLDIFNNLSAQVQEAGGTASIVTTPDGGTITTIKDKDNKVIKTITKDKANKTIQQ